HPFYAMLNIMSQIRTDQVEQEQTYYRKQPDFKCWKPLQYSKLIIDSPLRCHQKDEGQYKIDDNGSECKKYIDSGVVPFSVFKYEQRLQTFQYPKKCNPARQDHASMQRRYIR